MDSQQAQEATQLIVSQYMQDVDAHIQQTNSFLAVQGDILVALLLLVLIYGVRLAFALRFIKGEG